jgi:hypothetical protein
VSHTTNVDWMFLIGCFVDVLFFSWSIRQVRDCEERKIVKNERWWKLKSKRHIVMHLEFGLTKIKAHE